MSSAVERNVQWTIKQILAMPEAEKLRSGERSFVGGVYDLGTGKVRWFNEA